MLAEGELRSNSNLDESDKVRELQDKVAELKAEVTTFFPLYPNQNSMNSVKIQKYVFPN